MAGVAVSIPQPRRSWRAVLMALLGLVAVIPVAVVAQRVFDQVPGPPALAFAGGIAFAAYVLFAVRWFDHAVAIGFLLSGIVLVEPAPPDGAFSVLIALAIVTGRVRLDDMPRSILLTLASFLTLNILSMMEAVSVSAGLRFAFITVYLLVFSVWLCSWLDSERRARMLVISYLTVAVSTTLVGLLAYRLPIPTRALWMTSDFERVKGLFKDPNVYGPFVIPATMILLDHIMRPRLLKLRTPVALAFLIILALGVLFAFSRAAWGNAVLATVVTLAAGSLARRGGRRAVRTLIALVLVAIAAMGVLGATGQMAFLQERAHLQSYDTDRFASQRAGYEIGWQYPVGVGPGQFTFHHDLATHSTYVRTLAEQGFGGVLCWIAILVITLILAISNTIRGWNTYGIGAGALLGSWCGLILNSAVVDTLHWRHLWLVASLIWIGAVRNRRAERRARPAPVVTR